MRRRLRKFLPIVLMALVVQILAPIAACWAAGIAASDPLATAEICHNGAAVSDSSNPTDQGGGPHIHDGICCLVCGSSHVGVSLDASPAPSVGVPYRHAERVVWRKVARHICDVRTGSLAQARAPPTIS
jgi:Protein of unknown function (DUF2946)